VSTTDQDLSVQEAALKAAGCQVIRAERMIAKISPACRGAVLSVLPDMPFDPEPSSHMGAAHCWNGAPVQGRRRQSISRDRRRQ
jgi:hypothetical protein